MSPDHGRGHPRYAIEVAVGIAFPGGRTHGRTRNLSRGGLCALMDHALAPGTPVTIEITLVFGKDSFSEPLSLPARVVWCMPMNDKHQLGVAFLALGPEKLEYLEMFLRYLEEGKNAAAEWNDLPTA